MCSWSNTDPIFLWAPFPSGRCLFSTVHTMCLQHGALPASFGINRSCLLDTTLHEHGLDLGVLKAHPLHLTECLLAVNRFCRRLQKKHGVYTSNFGHQGSPSFQVLWASPVALCMLSIKPLNLIYVFSSFWGCLTFTGQGFDLANTERERVAICRW